MFTYLYIYRASIYIYVLYRYTSKKPCGHLFTEAIAPKPQTKPGEKPKACFLGLLQRSLVAILYYIYKSHCPKAPKKARRKAQSMFSCLPAGHYSIITAGQPCAWMAAPLAIQPAIPSSILPSSPLPSWTPILSVLRQEKIEVEPIETPKPNPCPAGKQHHGAHIAVEHCIRGLFSIVLKPIIYIYNPINPINPKPYTHI